MIILSFRLFNLWVQILYTTREEFLKKDSNIKVSDKIFTH